jgi:hypothetical protein
MRKLWLALMLVTSLTSFAVVSHARGKGGQDAGGGNVFEIEFKATGALLAKQIHDAGLTDSQLGFSWLQFDVATREVQVMATDEKLSLDGKSKSAINSSNQRIIVFNGQIWAILNLEQKRMLALHEYLRFTGVDDSEYTFTLRTLDLLKSPVSQGPGREKTYKILSAKNPPISTDFELTLENGVSGKLVCTTAGGAQGEPILEVSALTLKFPVPNQPGRFRKVKLNQNRLNHHCEFMNIVAMANPDDPVFLVIKGDGTYSFIQ